MHLDVSSPKNVCHTSLKWLVYLIFFATHLSTMHKRAVFHTIQKRLKTVGMFYADLTTTSARISQSVHEIQKAWDHISSRSGCWDRLRTNMIRLCSIFLLLFSSTDALEPCPGNHTALSLNDLIVKWYKDVSVRLLIIKHELEVKKETQFFSKIDVQVSSDHRNTLAYDVVPFLSLIDTLQHSYCANVV